MNAAMNTNSGEGTTFKGNNVNTKSIDLGKLVNTPNNLTNLTASNRARAS